VPRSKHLRLPFSLNRRTDTVPEIAMTGHLKCYAPHVGWVVFVAAMALGGRPARAADDTSPLARVRSHSLRVSALIREGVARSTTLRHLVETIDATDGLVYVEEGRCGHGVRACLSMNVTLAGPHRMLFILVEAHAPDGDLIGSIGHELKHAVEVLEARQVRSQSAMYFFYTQKGWTNESSFETQAAIDAGNAVRAEVRKR
jgi:hypothetical protein